MSNKNIHWATRHFHKHLNRTFWGVMAAYLFIWLHPSPAEAKVIIMLVAIFVLGLDMGVHITGYLIRKKGVTNETNK